MNSKVLRSVLVGCFSWMLLDCGSDDAATPAGGAGQQSAGNGQAGTAGKLAAGAGAGGAVEEKCSKDCAGLCLKGICCDGLRACGEKCCGAGQVCSFGECQSPGTSCYSSFECGNDEYCDTRLGVRGMATSCGATPDEGRCLQRPPTCSGEPSPAPGAPLTCTNECEVKPAASSFVPTLKYAWGGQNSGPTATDIMTSPIVVQLDDDDCDGQISSRDIPEIAFVTYQNGDYETGGVLHVLTAQGGKLVERWQASGFHPSIPLAGGEVDGQPGNELVTCRNLSASDKLGGLIAVYKGTDPTLLWQTEIACGYPAIADLDQDGKPEVIAQGGILDGATGAVKATFQPPLEGGFVVSDLDLDGKLDIVTNVAAYHADGQRFATTGETNFTIGSFFQASPAVADLDLDGKPEVIAIHYLSHSLAIWRYDPGVASKATMVRQGIDINHTLSPKTCKDTTAGASSGGGPVTVGDFNADGKPDVALAGGVGYAVLDGSKLMNPAIGATDTFLWVKETQDCTSAGTGSSLFDFNGDGKVEVVYADETHLRIYEGATGKVLFETCNTSATLSEYPVIADVDGDDQADLLVVSNAAYSSIIQCEGTTQSGLRVFHSPSWVRTRRVWNQHSYHITNVGEDGRIPKVEPPNWKQPGLNNFRQNKQPGLEFAAPDAVVALLVPACQGAYGLVATVRNVGDAELPAGVEVGFYAGSPPAGTKLGSATTKNPLGPAQAEDVSLPLPSAADVQSGAQKVYAVVDDTKAPHAWTECRKDNNTSAAVGAVCGAEIE